MLIGEVIPPACFIFLFTLYKAGLVSYQPSVSDDMCAAHEHLHFDVADVHMHNIVNSPPLAFSMIVPEMKQTFVVLVRHIMNTLPYICWYYVRYMMCTWAIAYCAHVHCVTCMCTQYTHMHA